MISFKSTIKHQHHLSMNLLLFLLHTDNPISQLHVAKHLSQQSSAANITNDIYDIFNAGITKPI